MSDSTHTWEDAVLWLGSQPDQADLVMACFYDDPLSAAAERYYLSSEWAVLPPRSGLALNLGSGRGISAYALARDGWRVVALEQIHVIDDHKQAVFVYLRKRKSLLRRIQQRVGAWFD